MRLHPEVEIFVGSIPDGVAGIEATLATMGAIVREYRRNPEVRGVALEILESVESKNYVGEARALFHYVQRTIRYTQDPDGVEWVQTPDKTILIGHGDCDDMATLLATMLASVGKPTRFVAAGFNGGPIEHVWTEVKIGGRWFAMDPTEIEAEFGWKPPGITETRVWHN